MTEIRFHATIGDDGLIRPPQGVVLAAGAVEVVVVPAEPHVPSSDNDTSADTAAGEHLFGRLAKISAESNTRDLPTDLAENHDHYAHGAPKGIDRS